MMRSPKLSTGSNVSEPSVSEPQVNERGVRADRRRRLRAALLLTLVVLAVECAGGILSHSLALLADATHLFADLAAA